MGGPPPRRAPWGSSARRLARAGRGRRPAARAERRSRHDHLGAFEVEAESNLAEAFGAEDVAQPGLVGGVKHQDAPPARPDELAADRPVLEREVVPAVDVGVRHLIGAPLLVLPVLVHDLAEADEVTLLQELAAALADLLDVVKVG